MPKVEDKKKNEKKKLDTAIIVAIIGLIGTLTVGILNSPLIIKLLDSAPTSSTPAEMDTPPNDAPSSENWAPRACLSHALI